MMAPRKPDGIVLMCVSLLVAILLCVSIVAIQTTMITNTTRWLRREMERRTAENQWSMKDRADLHETLSRLKDTQGQTGDDVRWLRKVVELVKARDEAREKARAKRP